MASKSLKMARQMRSIIQKLCIQKLVKRKSKISLDNEFYKFETTSSKISQSTVQNVTAGYIETLK